MLFPFFFSVEKYKLYSKTSIIRLLQGLNTSGLNSEVGLIIELKYKLKLEELYGNLWS